MKKLFTIFMTMSGCALLLLSSCKKNEALVESNGGKAGTLTPSATTLQLSKSRLTDTSTVVTFNFTKANFGFSAAITNTLQIDVPADNWKTPASYTLGNNSYSQGFNTADFNNLLLKLNIPGGTAGSIVARIQQSVGGAAAPIYSNVVTMTVTPFNLISYVYVPGTYQSSVVANQWVVTTADSLVSPTGNGVYTGYIYFMGGDQFKVTPAKSWATSYGDAGGGKISTSGGNITGPTTAGLYLVTVDLNQNTISWTYSTTYNHAWSLIGDAAVDWNTDFDMPFNQNANAYQVTVTLNTTGGFKFRADHAWTVSLGSSSTPPTLTATNGGNLSVTAAGTYVVSLSFGDPLYAPTYTAVKH